jgi:hypothetical protein
MGRTLIETGGKSGGQVTDNATDDTLITCGNCGQPLITWGHYKAAAVDMAKTELIKRFSKVKGFKPG